MSHNYNTHHETTVFQAPALNIVVPDKELIADTSALVVHLADAQVDIAGNTSKVAPLDVATTTRMFTFVELAHFRLFTLPGLKKG